MEKINKKIIAIIIALIIVVGMAITLTIGLNFELKYQATKKVELYLQKEFDINDIKQITDETIGNEVIIQKIEVYEDSVSIMAKDITEEQKTNLVNKINEKYGTEIKTEEVSVQSIPNTRGRDIVKPYILPFVISTAIIIVYMAIRYRKLGIGKVILKTALMTILLQLILLSVMAITRIPVGRLTIPLVITVYMLTLVGLTTKFEKEI